MENKKQCQCIENVGLDTFLAHFTDVVSSTGIDAAKFFMNNNVCTRGAARIMAYANIISLATMYGLHISSTENRTRPFTEEEVKMLYDFLVAGVEELRETFKDIKVSGENFIEDLANASPPSDHRH